MKSRPPDTGAWAGLAARERAESEAAAWIARRDAGLTAAEHEAFERWRAADPRHAEAWQELRAAWEAFDIPRRTGVAEAMMLELAARRRPRRWNLGWIVTTFAAAAAAAIWIIVPPRSVPDAAPVDATRAVLIAPEQRALPDKSIVRLSQRATLDVNFLPDERRVQLLTGEAQFVVARNPGRPFVVTAGGVKMRAVGTEFAVTIGAENVELLVTEGTVAVDRVGPSPQAPREPVAPGASEADPVLVTAGGLLVVPTVADSAPGSFHVQILSPAEIERRLEWLAPQMELSGTPLAEVVELFNRNAGAQIAIADAALAGLRMSGVFRADNVDGFLRLLEVGYGVEIERTGSGDVVLRLAP